jgi:hypothetical protein
VFRGKHHGSMTSPATSSVSRMELLSPMGRQNATRAISCDWSSDEEEEDDIVAGTSKKTTRLPKGGGGTILSRSSVGLLSSKRASRRSFLVKVDNPSARALVKQQSKRLLQSIQDDRPTMAATRSVRNLLPPQPYKHQQYNDSMRSSVTSATASMTERWLDGFSERSTSDSYGSSFSGDFSLDPTEDPATTPVVVSPSSVHQNNSVTTTSASPPHHPPRPSLVTPSYSHHHRRHDSGGQAAEVPRSSTLIPTTHNHFVEEPHLLAKAPPSYASSSLSPPPPPPQVVEYNRDMIEVAPGISLPLRGAAETWEAILDGRITVSTCGCCQVPLHCTDAAELVICPDCWVVSPIDTSAMESPTSSTGSCGSDGDDDNGFLGRCSSIGLGVKAEDIIAWMEQQEQ